MEKRREINMKTLKKKCGKFNCLYINFGQAILTQYLNTTKIKRIYCFRFDGDENFVICGIPFQEKFNIKVKAEADQFSNEKDVHVFHLNIKDLSDKTINGVQILKFNTEEERDLYWEMTKYGK